MNQPNFSIAVSPEMESPKERERGEWPVGGTVRRYTFIKFATLCGYGSWCPKMIKIITSKITDHRSP